MWIFCFRNWQNLKFFASEFQFQIAFCNFWADSLLLPTVTKNNVCYKVFILTDNKLLSCLPRPSRKQSIIFISSNSTLVFLAFSFVSASTEPQVSVEVFLWRALTKSCLLFFSKASFLQYSAFCPFFCFLVKKDCSLHFVKHVSTLCNLFPAESVLQQGI